MEPLLSQQYHRDLLFLCLCCSLFMLTPNSLASTHPGLQCHEDERSALLQFTQNFIVDCSESVTCYDDPKDLFSCHIHKPRFASWKKNEFANSNNSNHDCCMWDGIWCDETTGHIIGLDLSYSCLSGSFPQNSTLFKLTHLRYLNLRGNNFKHSHIPQSFGQLHNLISLNLSLARFSGQIPLEISRLSNLRALDLSNSGAVTSYDTDKLLKLHNPNLKTLLNNLTKLTRLALDFVDISSTVTPITSHLSNHTSLRRFSLVSTNLIGKFPSSIFQLPHLEYLDISVNDLLTGVLPEFQRNSSSSYNLIEIDLSRTGFSGKIPTSLGDRLTKLKRLVLSSCKFTGEVPSSLVNLTALDYLNLGNNSITITPTFFTMLSKLNKLTHLNIASVDFVKPTTFPPCLRNLTKLELFYAWSCQFMGAFPYWLPSLTHLRWLNLSHNNLSNINFGIFLKFKHLKQLHLDGMSLVFPPINVIHNKTISSNIPQFQILGLGACNIIEFPEFLKYQHELKYLDLYHNHIHGLIPQWLGNTSKDTLQGVDMSGNILTGFEQSADPRVIIPWPNIRYLYMRDNKLQGSIPSTPTSLLAYELGNNSLTGDIPESICSSSIQFLDLSYNNLSGKIPKCFDKLGDSLVVLDLQANKLQGMIPQNFSGLCTLKAINLNYNQLEGALPRSVANCNKLRLLDIGNNAINDTFPSWLGNLQELQILVLRYNHFHGVVLGNTPPLSNDYFLNLRILDLSNNFLTGCLPVEYIQNFPAMRNLSQELHYMAPDAVWNVIGTPLITWLYYDYVFAMTNKGADMVYMKILDILKLIDLSSNNFTGKIPASIGNLTGLVGLNISNNDLTGEIPSSFANLAELECLDLSHNKLSGEIPDELRQITYLEIFNVSHNHLMGPIPHGKQFDTFDNSSYQGNQGLCGDPLSKRCEDTDNSLLPSTQDENYDKEEDLDWVDWLVRLLGCGSGLVIGFIGGKIFTGRHHEWFVETFGRIQRKRRVKRPRRSKH